MYAGMPVHFTNLNAKQRAIFFIACFIVLSLIMILLIQTWQYMEREVELGKHI
jgi:hypothetical protein